MQGDSKKKKERRRSSIMVVEKSGQQDEILKGAQDDKAGDPGRSTGESAAETSQGGADAKNLEKEGALSSNSKKEKEDSPPKHKSEDREEESNTFRNVMNNTHNNHDQKEKKDEEESEEPQVEEENRIPDEATKKRGREDDVENKTDSGSADEASAEKTEGQDKKKAVGFAEERNTEHEIKKDANKSIPVDVEERNVRENTAKTAESEGVYGTLAPGEDSSNRLAPGCEIEKERQHNHIVYEGSGFKRRWIFYCFWVQRYFIMTKDGIIKYYRSKDRPGSVFMKASDLDVVSRVDRQGKHPYQIVLNAGGRENIMGFDSSNIRDAWTMKLSEVIRNNREKN